MTKKKQKKIPKFLCCHCNRMIAKGHFGKYHGDKCKNKLVKDGPIQNHHNKEN